MTALTQEQTDRLLYARLMQSESRERAKRIAAESYAAWLAQQSDLGQKAG